MADAKNSMYFRRSMTKILIIRFSSIGDIVLTTPVIRNLKEQFLGGVEIHYLTKRKFQKVIEPNPHIARVIAFEKSTNEVMDQLKAEAYHYIIDLHRNLRSARVKAKLKVLDFTFDKLNWQKWLLVNFGINKLPDLHIVDRYMKSISPFGIINDNKGLEYFFADSDRVLPGDLPSSFQNGFITIGIGAAHWRKKPREAQYIEICKRLNTPIALIGGADEKELGERIASQAGANAWNTAGGFSLGGTASLIEQSLLLITPDTGVMHIAAALKKPIISIWAATIPGLGMYPYQNRALNEMIQANHLSRRPCSKLGTKCKYKECKCIDELPLDELIDKAEGFLEKSAV